MKFEKENSTSYMVLECNNNVISEYDVSVVEKEVCTSLLPMHMRGMGGKMFCYYDITARQQVCKLYEYTKLRYSDVAMICRSIANLVKEIDEYMLDLKYVKLDVENMFIDLCENRLLFVYFPEEKNDDDSFGEGIRKLFDYCLEHFDHNANKSDVMKVYEIYQRIVQGNYDAKKMDELVVQDDVADKPEDIVSDMASDMTYDKTYDRASVALDVIPPQVIEDEIEEKNDKLTNIILMFKVIMLGVALLGVSKIVVPDIMPINISMKVAIIMVLIGIVAILILSRIPKEAFATLKKKSSKQDYEVELDVCTKLEGETEVTTHTMLLSDYLKKNCNPVVEQIKLINYEYEDVISINSFPAIIGTWKDKCTVCIDDLLVSRMHACIAKGDDTIYIEDLNSTNGTKLNDEALLPNQKIPLKSGDQVTLATRIYKVEIS